MAQVEEQEGKHAGQDKKGKSGWPATLGRSLKDNAALIGAILALAGVLITQIVTANIAERGLAVQRELEEERAREAELQTYFDSMGRMLLDEDNPLAEAEAGSAQSSLARAKTLTMLERLDAQRKRIVLQFLYESQLIQKEEPVVSLVEADLSYADLSRANLPDADLSGANLSSANLSYADLSSANLSRAQLMETNLSGVGLERANLSVANLNSADLEEAHLNEADLNEAVLAYAYLRGADLIEANLIEANLVKAQLIEANLGGADLRYVALIEADLTRATLYDADLSRANLIDATGITDEKLAQAKALEGATMPDGSVHD